MIIPTGTVLGASVVRSCTLNQQVGSAIMPNLSGGKGCVKDVNWERGGLQRVLLDRTSPLYKAIYTQRTSCERINSQAKELGIERRHPYAIVVR